MRAVTAQQFARGLFALAIAFLVVAAAQYAIRANLRARADATCERNLRQIATALQNYMQHDVRGRYPLLQAVPGELMFDKKLVIDSDFFSEVAPVTTPYWYLGWMIPNERSGLEWIEKYRAHVHASDQIPELLEREIWPDFEDDLAARQRAADADWYRFHPDGKPLPGEGPKAGRLIVGPKLEETRFYCRLRNGMERFLMTDIGNPAGGSQIQYQIPVIVERPDRHSDGGHVLYMDGHAEFVPYPGKFPMTPKFIEGLRSLDELEK